MSRKFLFILFLFICNLGYSQTYVKLNTITTTVLIPNIGIETAISDKWSFQADVTASFWKSIKKGPFKFVTLTPEFRYHLKDTENGLYVGGHIGGSIFKLQKWNYTNTNYYQKGVNYFIGATIGYQKKITDKLALDLFLGGGSQQGFYKGYYLDTNTRYDPAKKYNKSGEWLPYRGGLMICYKID